MGLGVEGIGAVDDHRVCWNREMVPENMGYGSAAELRHLLSAGSVQISVQSIIGTKVCC